MPKAGFKSITVSESVYDKFYDVFLKNKDDLAMKGVNSFSGYVTYMLEEMMQKDKTFARYAPKIEKISVDDNRIILKDNIINRIACLLDVAVTKERAYLYYQDLKDFDIDIIDQAFREAGKQLRYFPTVAHIREIASGISGSQSYDNYDQYLKSEKWERKRKQALFYARYRCQICNAKGEIHVHHRVYENLGNEPLSDLVVLCEK